MYIPVLHICVLFPSFLWHVCTPYFHRPYYITFHKPFSTLLLPVFSLLPVVFLTGERKIVDTDAGAVIVANVEGSFYAVLAKCPHLGLPMKTGK